MSTALAFQKARKGFLATLKKKGGWGEGRETGGEKKRQRERERKKESYHQEYGCFIAQELVSELAFKMAACRHLYFNRKVVRKGPGSISPQGKSEITEDKPPEEVAETPGCMPCSFAGQMLVSNEEMLRHGALSCPCGREGHFQGQTAFLSS